MKVKLKTLAGVDVSPSCRTVLAAALAGVRAAGRTIFRQTLVEDHVTLRLPF
jgi:hypothetical protein